ncbi:MAG: 5-formyltetrahydrofolate cyclo-ligase [Rhodospirillales bacterium]
MIPSEPTEERQALRARMRAARALASQKKGLAGLDSANHHLARLILDRLVEADRKNVVAFYMAFGAEPDPSAAFDMVLDAGHLCVLPVVSGEGRPLDFRPWLPGQPLKKGFAGTMEPLADPDPEAFRPRPSIIVTPLVAFDRKGNRLGLGGGYYDRTLAERRAGGRVKAVGFAWAEQEVSAVPSQSHDQKLDWIATDEGVIEVAVEKVRAS